MGSGKKPNDKGVKNVFGFQTFNVANIQIFIQKITNWQKIIKLAKNYSLNPPKTSVFTGYWKKGKKFTPIPIFLFPYSIKKKTFLHYFFFRIYLLEIIFHDFFLLFCQ